LEKIV